MNSVLQQGQKDKKYLIQIGRITVVFAVLESTVNWLIWELMECNHQIGAIITTPMSFSRLLELLSSLGEYKGGKINKFIVDNIQKFRDCGEKRNKIIHSIWSDHIDEDGNPFLLRVKMNRKQKKGKKLQIEKMTVENLKDFADHISYIQLSLMDCIRNF